MMNIQLDTCARSRPNWPITAICTGTMPTAYHRNVVMPAQPAGAVKSLKNERRRAGTAPEPRTRVTRPAYGLVAAAVGVPTRGADRGRKGRTVAIHGKY